MIVDIHVKIAVTYFKNDIFFVSVVVDGLLSWF